MELQLKNIGMIKEANIKIDGLTVIAGENDTGKSTVGKALYLQLQSIFESASLNSRKSYFDSFNSYIGKYFESQITEKGLLRFIDNNIVWENHLNQNFIDKKQTKSNKGLILNLSIPIMVETPLVWNFTDFFRDIALIESQMRIEVDYPSLLKDLNFKLFIRNASNTIDIRKRVIDLMGGEFKKDEMGRYFFEKNKKRIELVNTATGIKTFGIFQILSQNNYLNNNIILILDEPEVHLHPKWQLEMAKIIVDLVDNGMQILVNSHSPYMIQALIKYSRDKNIVDKSNFYLTKKDGDYATIDNVNEELNKIFELLAEPMNEVYE